jgi:phosphoglycolate phosphatase-like HAD superfamily hydrolase
MIKAMIFDLDGTIGDTIPLCIKAFRKSMESFMRRNITDEEIVATFGPSEEGTIKALIPAHYEEGVKQYLYYYKEFHEACPKPFDGIIEVIRALKNKGIVVAMVTGKGRKSVDITLEQFGMVDLFECIEAGSINGARKCEGITCVIEYLNINPEEAYYIGDAPNDIIAARSAGVGIISAAWADMVCVEELERLKPDNLFRTIKEFEEFIFARNMEIG